MSTRREFFSSLEGIRGYAFLLVFFLHYLCAYFAPPANPVLYPLYLLNQTAWFLVPIFFVLSGFLITRILLATREREGYFRVFYLRRSMRILPLYFLTLLVLFLIMYAHHWPMHREWLLYLVYLQNLSHACLMGDPRIGVVHLWSLAIEEQFYLLWPIVLWFLRSEKAVVRFCIGSIALSCLIRIAWPVFHSVTYFSAYYFSLTRADAILIGALLAIWYKNENRWKQLVRWSWFLIPVLWSGAAAFAVVHGTALPSDYIGVALMIPLQNVIGTCFVILALEPEGFIQRACSNSHICKIGRLSYGLYVFHFLYLPYLFSTVAVALTRYTPVWLANILTSLVGLGITFALGGLVWQFVEKPALVWKDRIKYGQKIPQVVPVPAFEQPAPSWSFRAEEPRLEPSFVAESGAAAQ
jgi:peptidoglycan/LPS O-acetylase OafA/YrhL